MEILRLLVAETSRVAIGIYGLFLVCVIAGAITETIERLVRWSGIQKSKYSRSKTRRI